MANYKIKLVLRPKMVLRSRCYPKSKITHSWWFNLTQYHGNYSFHSSTKSDSILSVFHRQMLIAPHNR